MSIFPLIKKETPAFTGSHDQLDDALKSLLRYGKPRLYFNRYENGWRVIVEMNTTISGAKFEINSEVHKAPLDAVNECLRRISEAVQGRA